MIRIHLIRIHAVLGPLLFLLFVDDIDTVVEPNTFVCKFADDLKLYYIYNPTLLTENAYRSEVNPLQKSLNNVLQWSVMHKLPLNLNKCSVIHFGHKNQNIQYKLDQNQLDVKVHERDLGVIMDSTLKFDVHVTNIVRKARRTAGLMFHTFSSRRRDVILPVFNSLIRPVLEYASPVWNDSTVKHQKILESVQRHVTKRILGCTSLTYCNRLESLNLCSLKIRRDYFDLIEMYKILHEHTKVRCASNIKFATNITRGHSFKLCKPKFNLNLRKSSFLVRTIDKWNALPSDIVQCNTVQSFKNCLRSYLKISH